MAVSLKKPEKVVLSKPNLPRKLPEYTPIHLIDEAETIKSRPVPPKTVDLETSKPDEAPSPRIDKIDIDLECSNFKSHRINLNLARIIFTFSYLAIGVSFLAYIISLCRSIDIDSTEIDSTQVDVSIVLDSFFSIISAAFNWFLNSPPAMLIFGISLLVFFVHSLRNIFKFR